MKNRFWEYYLIRYLAGTIFGVAIVMYLFTNYSEDIGNSFYKDEYHNNIQNVVNSYLFDTTYFFEGLSPDKIRLDNNELVIGNTINNETIYNGNRTIRKNEVTVLSMITLAVVGFLYMYISSAVVLFFHTFRFLITCLIKGGRKSYLYEFYMILSRTRAKGKQAVSKKTDDTEDMKEFKGEYWISEYVESYRHLREHGNAFGILLSELAFALFLIKTNFQMGWIAGWLALGFISWWVATYMEIKLQKNHIHRFKKEH